MPPRGGTRLFGRETLTWRLNREPACFLGGGRALLMQVAHPAIAAGVERHSDYRAHPWQRLVRTLDTTLKMAFASETVARRASGRLVHSHVGVHGLSRDGIAYDARDPDLMLWVWATLLDTTLVMHRSCVRQLSEVELERYYAEQKRFALACGLSEKRLPQDWADFSRYFGNVVGNDLRVTDAARSIARTVLLPTPRALSPFLIWHSVITTYLLPDSVRDAYEIPLRFDRPVAARRMLESVKLASWVVPGPVRRLPISAIVAVPERFSQPLTRRQQVPSGVGPGVER